MMVKRKVSNKKSLVINGKITVDQQFVIVYLTKRRQK
jgi:hypothetical protein